jgi:hypothetical protein
LCTTGHISSTACVLLLFAGGIISGCAAVAVGAASEAVSGKTVTDYVISTASGKNCDVLEGAARSCSGARRPENGVLPWFLDHQAARTDSGRSSIRLRTVTAIWVSTSWADRVCERKVSPMMRLYRLIAPSAPALAL